MICFASVFQEHLYFYSHGSWDPVTLLTLPRTEVCRKQNWTWQASRVCDSQQQHLPLPRGPLLLLQLHPLFPTALLWGPLGKAMSEKVALIICSWQFESALEGILNCGSVFLTLDFLRPEFYGMYVEVRGKQCRAVCLLPTLFEFWGSSSDGQVCSENSFTGWVNLPAPYSEFQLCLSVWAVTCFLDPV